MRLSRRPAPAQSPGGLLAYYGAQPFPVLRNWWVYALLETGGAVFYVGKSEGLNARLGRHMEGYGARIDRIMVIPCRDEYQADVREQALIDEYQPAMNGTGTAEVERRRLAARRRAAPFAGDPFGHRAREAREAGG